MYDEYYNYDRYMKVIGWTGTWMVQAHTNGIAILETAIGLCFCACVTSTLVNGQCQKNTVWISNTNQK